jgi:hypothetical protein
MLGEMHRCRSVSEAVSDAVISQKLRIGPPPGAWQTRLKGRVQPLSSSCFETSIETFVEVLAGLGRPLKQGLVATSRLSLTLSCYHCCRAGRSGPVQALLASPNLYGIATHSPCSMPTGSQHQMAAGCEQHIQHTCQQAAARRVCE